MNERADWIAWSLQFFVGLVVGALAGVAMTGGWHRRSSLITPQTTPAFILGAALLGAAMASYYGDELWVGSSYHILPPDFPKHSTASRWASIIVGCTGVVLLLASLAKSFGVWS